VTEKWRRARDSNPQGPRGPVDFKYSGVYLPKQHTEQQSATSAQRY